MQDDERTRLERFTDLPWGAITALINVVAGVVFAIGMGLATVAQQLPPSLADQGAMLSIAGLVASALSAGLFAIGKGLYNIGDGQMLGRPEMEQNVTVGDGEEVEGEDDGEYDETDEDYIPPSSD